jgi:ligand-binding sensor domain-containing protein
LWLHPLLALDPRLALTQYLHTKWTYADGWTGGRVSALTQTPDGYLWVGTTSRGLFRFDGLQFTSWKGTTAQRLPSTEISALYTSPGGALWIGTSAGVSRLENGNLVNYGVAEGVPAGVCVSIVEDHAGGLWVVVLSSDAGRALKLQRNERFVEMMGGSGSSAVFTLFEDSRGDLWAGTASGLCRWAEHQPACIAGPKRLIRSITEDGDGTLIVSDSEAWSLLRLTNDTLQPLTPGPGQATLTTMVLLSDKESNIWAGTLGQGLLRWTNGKTEALGRLDGLSGDLVEALLEDREGNLWVGTSGGLDRFQTPTVSLQTVLEGLSGDFVTAVYTSQNGDVWVGTSGQGLNRLRGGRILTYTLRDGLPSTTVLSVHEDAQRRLWVGTTGGLAYRTAAESESGGFVSVRGNDGSALRRVFAITGDESVTWLADASKGLLRIPKGSSVPEAVSYSLPSRLIYQIQADSMGKLWVGYLDGGITVLAGEGAKHFGPGDGLPNGPVQAIHEDGAGTIWVGTIEGLSRFRNGRWTTWTVGLGLPEGGVQAILDDGQKGLWMKAPNELVRLSGDCATADRRWWFRGLRCPFRAGLHLLAPCVRRTPPERV